MFTVETNCHGEFEYVHACFRTLQDALNECKRQMEKQRLSYDTDFYPHYDLKDLTVEPDGELEGPLTGSDSDDDIGYAVINHNVSDNNYDEEIIDVAYVRYFPIK